jgi:dihydroneopterin aldolase
MTGIYTITLQNCAFFARHGVHDEEEFLGQRFFVDAELDVVAGDALEKDSIEDTVITGKRRYLIESLAVDVAKGLCNRFPQIRRAKITVRKPNAPVPGVLDYVQVSVEHLA